MISEIVSNGILSLPSSLVVIGELNIASPEISIV